jgi:hypothetical protein
MSKKMSRQKKRNSSLPLIALLVGGLILVLAAFGFSLLNRNDAGEGGGDPAIAVDQERIDYGDVKLDTPLTFQFKVTNTGSGTLKFTQEPYIEVVEGC